MEHKCYLWVWQQVFQWKVQRSLLQNAVSKLIKTILLLTYNANIQLKCTASIESTVIKQNIHLRYATAVVKYYDKKVKNWIKSRNFIHHAKWSLTDQQQNLIKCFGKLSLLKSCLIVSWIAEWVKIISKWIQLSLSKLHEVNEGAQFPKPPC